MARKLKAHGQIIPGLDGLRALAVLSVVFYHLFPKALPGGYIGVDIFFVISGFLITTLLIAEHAKQGTIDLKKFWLRRARRLLPALFTTILIICSVVFFVRGDSMVGIGQQILGASTFSSNWIEIIAGTDYFSRTSPHLFMNFWSLGVEEQFYLLWPLLVLLVVGIIKKPRIGMLITALLALASAGLMTYLFYHGVSASRVYYGTDTHMFGLMIGAFLAFWSRVQTVGQPLRRLYQPFWKLRMTPLVTQGSGLLALAALIVLLLQLSDQSPLAYSGGLLLASIVTSIILVVTVSTHGLLQMLFTVRPLKWIGSRSYGVYLWHWPLLILLRQLSPSTPVFEWLLPVALVVLTFGIAELSYRFLEIPIRQYGFRSLFKGALKRWHISTNYAPVHTFMRPHSVTLVVFLAIGLTVAAVVSAPTKTSAQLSIERGQKAMSEQTVRLKKPSRPVKKIPLDGEHITAIGDSVMLASTPFLQEKFPGILINAEVSRSIRRGGLETISQLQSAGELRDIVIIGLGTNGYLGPGSLDQLIVQLTGHKIILVTAHADREWTTPNNSDMEAAAKRYSNVTVSEWDQAIAPHPDFLAEDGIHPNSNGDAIYADCITESYKKFR